MARWWNRDLADVEPLINPNPRPGDTEDLVIPAALLTNEVLRDFLHRAADEKLRGENALLREHIAELQVQVASEQECVVELTQALDHAKPVPTPHELGAHIERVWHKQPDHLHTTERWSRVAESVIDHVRGLWPVGNVSPLAPDDVAALDSEALRVLLTTSGRITGWPFTQTSPGGEGSAGTAVEAAPTRAHTPGDPMNVAGGTEVAVTPTATPRAGEPPAPGDDPLDAVDQVRDQLAQTIARRDLAHARTDWAGLPPLLRESFRDTADDVINAGWRVPLGTSVDVRPVVAAVLTAHELLADDTCRCGWGDWHEMPPHSEPAVLWHAEHVADQLVGTGALA